MNVATHVIMPVVLFKYDNLIDTLVVTPSAGGCRRQRSSAHARALTQGGQSEVIHLTSVYEGREVW